MQNANHKNTGKKGVQQLSKKCTFLIKRRVHGGGDGAQMEKALDDPGYRCIKQLQRRIISVARDRLLRDGRVAFLDTYSNAENLSLILNLS